MLADRIIDYIDTYITPWFLILVLTFVGCAIFIVGTFGLFKLIQILLKLL